MINHESSQSSATDKVGKLSKVNFHQNIRTMMPNVATMSPDKLQEVYEWSGRNRLKKARENFFTSLHGILRANSQEEKRKFIPRYAESIKEIVDASQSIAYWKIVEGKALTDSVKEQAVREELTNELLKYEFVKEEGNDEVGKWVAISIQTTKNVQARLGVTEDPPEGGLRAEYEKGLEGNKPSRNGKRPS